MLCRRCCALFWKSIGHPCLVPEHIATIGTPSSSPSMNTNNSTVCYVDEKRKLSDPVAGAPRPIDRQRIRSGDDTQFETSPELFVPVTPQTFLTFFSV